MEIISFLIQFSSENTLSSSTYTSTATYTLIFYTIYFFICKKFVFQNNNKKLCWCITLLNSFFTSFICILYLYIKYLINQSIFNSSPTNSSLESFVSSGSSSGTSESSGISLESSESLGSSLDSNSTLGMNLITGNDNMSIIISIIFGCVTFLDLFYGLIFYREQLSLLTTYIHHTLYIWLMYFIITGDGIFIKTPTPFSKAFMWCLIEELPTFLLALGSIFPSLRSDLAFGISFFLLRIVYHLYVFYITWNLGAYTPMIVLYFITLGMHFIWFYTWFVKYGIYYITGKKKEKKEKKVN